MATGSFQLVFAHGKANLRHDKTPIGDESSPTKNLQRKPSISSFDIEKRKKEKLYLFSAAACPRSLAGGEPIPLRFNGS